MTQKLSSQDKIITNYDSFDIIEQIKKEVTITETL